MRHTALILLSQIPGPETTVVILRLAEKTTEDSFLRVEALSVLSREAGPEILDRLKNLAGSETDFTVRSAAAAAAKEVESREKTGK